MCCCSAGTKNHAVTSEPEPKQGYDPSHPAYAVLNKLAIFTQSPFDGPSVVRPGLEVLDDDQATPLQPASGQDAAHVVEALKRAGEAEAKGGVFPS